MNDWILSLLRHVILSSMRRTPEFGISCVEEIVLSSAMAKVYREAIAAKTTKTIPSFNPPPKPELEPFQSIIANFDGVWLIEDHQAYQPMVIGRPVTELERRTRKDIDSAKLPRTP